MANFTKGFAVHDPNQFPVKSFARAIRESLVKFQHELDSATAGALMRVAEMADREETLELLASTEKQRATQCLGRLCGELGPQGDKLKFVNVLERVMREGNYASSSEINKFKEAVGRHLPLT